MGHTLELIGQMVYDFTKQAESSAVGKRGHMKLQIFWIILGILFFGYGVLVLATRSGTSFFLIWFALGLLCFFLAAARHFSLFSGLPQGVRIAGKIVLCILAAVFIVTEGFIISAFRGNAPDGLDTIIVLGAQVRESGPSVVLKYRLDAACDYLTENEQTLCIVSGGQGPNEPFPEAEGMKRYLISRGIPPERILTESESENTVQNIRNSMQILKGEEHRVGIVTNQFHLFRACALAKKAGLTPVYGIAADSSLPYLPNNLLREFFGVIKDLLAGNIL